MFQEKKIFFKINNSPQESFGELPDQVTRASLGNLKNELSEFDLSIDKTAELDIQIEMAYEIEQSLLFLVKSRFNEYLEDITELESLDLSLDERNTLSEIKAVVLNLIQDVELYVILDDSSLSFNTDSELMKRILDTFPFIADDLDILKSVNYLLSKDLITLEDIDEEEEGSFRSLGDFDLVKNAVEIHKDWNKDFEIWNLSLYSEIYSNVSRTKIFIERFQGLGAEISGNLLMNILNSNSDKFIIDLFDSNLLDKKSFKDGNELEHLTEDDRKLCISAHKSSGLKLREEFLSILLTNSPNGKRLLALRPSEEIQNILKVFYLFFDKHITATLNEVLSLLDASVDIDFLSVLIQKGVFSNLEFTTSSFQVLTNLDKQLVDMIVKVYDETGKGIRPDDLNFYKELIQNSNESPEKFEQILGVYKLNFWVSFDGLECIKLCKQIVDLELEATLNAIIKFRISFREFRDSGFQGFVDLIELIKQENLLENFRELPSNLKRAFDIKLIEVVRLFKELSSDERLKALEFYESLSNFSEEEEYFAHFNLAVNYTKNGFTKNDIVLFEKFESIDTLNIIVEKNLVGVLRYFYSITNKPCNVLLAEYLNGFEQLKQLKIINFLKKLEDIYEDDEVYSLLYVDGFENLDEKAYNRVLDYLQGGFYSIPSDDNQEGSRQPLVFPINKLNYFVTVSQLSDAKLTDLKNMGQEVLNSLRHRLINISDFELSIETFQVLNKMSASKRAEIYIFFDQLCELGLTLDFSSKLIVILNQLKTFDAGNRNRFLDFFRQASNLSKKRSNETIPLYELDSLLSIFKSGSTQAFLDFYNYWQSDWNFNNVSIYAKIAEMNLDAQRDFIENTTPGSLSVKIIDFHLYIDRLPDGKMKTYCKKVKKLYNLQYSPFEFFIKLLQSNDRFKRIITELADRDFVFVKENLLLARYLTEDLPSLDISDLDKILDAYELLLGSDSVNLTKLTNFFNLLNKGYLNNFNIKNIYEYSFFANNLGLDRIIQQFLFNADYSGLPSYVQQKIKEKPVYDLKKILFEYKYYSEFVEGNQISSNMVSGMQSFVRDGKLVVDDSNYQEVEEFISRVDAFEKTHNSEFFHLEEYKFDVVSCLSSILPGNNFTEDPVKVFLKLLNVNLSNNNLDVNKMTFLVTLDNYSRDSYSNTQIIGNGSLGGSENIPSLDTLFLSESVNLNNLPRWFSPSGIEKLRVFYGDKIGFSESTDAVYGLFQRFMDTNPVSYANSQKYIDLAMQFKDVTFESGRNSNGASIYRLLARFLLNQVANFLVEQLGPKDKNLSKVKSKLNSFGIKFKTILETLNNNGFKFELAQGSLSKAARSLRQGKISYLLSSAWAKVKAKVASRPDELSKISVSRASVDWQAPEGVKVEALQVDERERVKLISVDPANIRFDLEMGSGDMFKPQDRLKRHSGAFFFASLAFSSSHGEITELAFDRGKVVSQLLSATGNDAFVFVNTRGQLSILDKRNLMIHDVYEAVGLPVQGENRQLKITTNLRDYTLFIRLIKQSRASLLASMMFVTDGRGEISSNLQEKSRRMLLQYNNGRIAILDSTDDLSTNEAVQIALSSGELRYAVYMDTGNFDTAFYYESTGDSHQLGSNGSDHLSSNILVLSPRVERMDASEVHEPKLIRRSEWGAQAPREGADFTRYSGDLSEVLNSIVVHHSAMSPSDGPREIQTHVMNKGYDDIGYHFVIGSQGEIYEGRPIDVMGAHAGQSVEANQEARAARTSGLSENKIRELVEMARQKDPDYGAIGVVLTGNFSNSQPTEAQRNALTQLLAYLKVKYAINSDRILGHTGVQAHLIESEGLTSTGNSDTGDSDVHTVCPGEHGMTMIDEVIDVLPADHRHD